MSARLVVLHGVDDTTVTKRCCNALEQSHVSCWSPYFDLGWSRDPHADTRIAIDGAEGLLLVVGEDGEASDDALQILAYAQSKGKFCFLGSGNGVPKGVLGGTLWDEVANVEGGNVAAIVAALPKEAPRVVAQLSMPAVESVSFAAYPRGEKYRAGLVGEFASLHTRSIWAIVFIVLPTMMFFFRGLTDLRSMSIAMGTPSGHSDFSYLVKQSIFGNLLFFGALGLIIISLIPFLSWVSHATKNLKAFGIDPFTFSSDFAIWGFFVPVVNVVLPLLVMAGLGKASLPSSRAGDLALWKNRKTPDVIVLWIFAWYTALFVLPPIRSQFTLGYHGGVVVAYYFMVQTIQSVMLIMSGCALCVAILKISRWQDEQYDATMFDASRVQSSSTSLMTAPVF